VERILDETKRGVHLPGHFFLGVALALFFWYASWTHLGVLGQYAFFPQWLGYILTVDGLVVWRTGTSLLTRHPREFMALFFLSAPIWWIFEGLNDFVQNWHYATGRPYSPVEYILIATIDFSTVVPAVFETTQLLLTFAFFERLSTRWRLVLSPRGHWVSMFLGAVGLLALIFFPRIAFPLTWLWVVLIADPLNDLRGRPSLVGQVGRGDWRMVVALALAAMVCGLFWEMWNYFAMPKWFYTVPIVGFAKIFEMPAFGYLGYWPFGWELYTLYQLFWGMLRRPPVALTAGADGERQGPRPEFPSQARN
jgi:hypothetical protein